MKKIFKKLIALGLIVGSMIFASCSFQDITDENIYREPYKEQHPIVVKQ